MKGETRTKGQLISELTALRKRMTGLETSEALRLEAESQRDIALEALQASEDRLRVVADFTCDWEYWIDPVGKFRYVSPSCEWITGYSPDEFEKDPGLLGSITHPDDRVLIAKHLEEGLKSPAEAYIEFRIVTRSGEECWIEHLCNPVYSADGRYLGQRASNRDITARVQAEDAIRRLYGELSTLYEASTAISSDLSLDVVLGTVAEQMALALDASGCALSLWNRERDLVERLVDYKVNQPDDTVPPDATYALDNHPAMRRVLEDCEPLLIQRDDPTADKAELALMEARGACTVLMLPLVARDRVLGLVHLYNEVEARDYLPPQMRLAESLAAQAAIAIENARLFEQAQQEIIERTRVEEEIRRRNLELALLNRVVSASTSTLDVDYVLRVACEELARVFDLPQAVALVLNAEGTEGTVVAEHLAPGHPSRLDQTLRFAGNPALNQLLAHAAPLAVIDVQTDEQLTSAFDLACDSDTVSLLIVPIILARGRVAGAIELHATLRREFTADEITLAQNVAAAVGQVLETARLYQAVRRNVEILEETVAQRTLELQEALLRAQDADRVKSEFVSNVSHELRTPLANLKLYLHLLSRGRPEKRESYMTTLRREVDRLQNLIEALLDVSRLDLGKTKANLEPIDLNLLITTLVTDRWALVTDRGLNLDVEADETLPLTLADPKLVEQVLTNLLTNGVNYTPAGGVITLRTELAQANGQRWVTASVTDTGPGISEEEQGHLFERFYRGEAGRASSAPGTGLGLAICREIMDLHNGRITVDSELGTGSTFTIWLTVAQ